ncbi:MAG: hypothetical protein NT030_08670 [Candidatus Saganbacteria bacterium]|nr:hypothetical protein [Candidatus Saganbacteria bacterium]
MKYKVILFMFIFLINSFMNSKANDLILAVLDQPQCKDDSDLMVRILFTKKNNEWIPLDKQSSGEPFTYSKVTWTVTFDGRNIGRVQASDLQIANVFEDTYQSVKLLQIKQGANIPKVLNKSEDFWGWCNVPKFRPLILVSKPNFRDPAKWKPFMALKETRNQLFPEFKKVAGTAKRCLTDQGTDQISYIYQPQDLTIFKSYKNELRQKLISIGLNPELYKCDGIVDPQWKPYWFLIDKQIRYIGTELMLVDAGDYDNDGKSEMIFWHSGYNEDGYSLFYNNFNSRTDFYWKYH